MNLAQRRPSWRARRLAARWGKARLAATDAGVVLERPRAVVDVVRLVALEVVFRQAGGVWCGDGARPVSPATQYAMVDAVGCGLVDTVGDRAVVTESGWRALAVAYPHLVG